MTWRALYARNEVIHDKLLHTIEGSCRFLCSYAHTLDNIRKLSTKGIVKGKHPMQPRPVVPAAEPMLVQPKEKWEKPEPGMVKLNVDGSFWHRMAPLELE
jgi:hypothetical protein